MWTARGKMSLGVGVALWAIAVAMTPGELAAAKRHAPIDARTAIALVAYAIASLCVLAGLPRRAAPPALPSMPPPSPLPSPARERGRG